MPFIYILELFILLWLRTLTRNTSFCCHASSPLMPQWKYVNMMWPLYSSQSKINKLITEYWVVSLHPFYWQKISVGQAFSGAELSLFTEALHCWDTWTTSFSEDTFCYGCQISCSCCWNTQKSIHFLKHMTTCKIKLTIWSFPCVVVPLLVLRLASYSYFTV